MKAQCAYLYYFYRQVLILEAGECRSLEVGVARKNYQSHVIRNRGWHNECVGYHIKGDIFDAVTANTILEVEGLVDMMTIYLIHR